MPVIKQKVNLFDTNADVLINPVNTKGVSGCGVALQFKQRYPETQKLYEEACKNEWIKLGTPYIISVPKEETTINKPKYIICFPTKIAPKRNEKSKLSTISNGLLILHNRCLDLFPPTYKIALPRLGCGAGNLNEAEVVQLIETVLQDVPQKVILCV
jgi:O-acetyl-ADP-ribose deacetylase (regulator of RNase III)